AFSQNLVSHQFARSFKRTVLINSRVIIGVTVEFSRGEGVPEGKLGCERLGPRIFGASGQQHPDYGSETPRISLRFRLKRNANLSMIASKIIGEVDEKGAASQTSSASKRSRRQHLEIRRTNPQGVSASPKRDRTFQVLCLLGRRLSNLQRMEGPRDFEKDGPSSRQVF